MGLVFAITSQQSTEAEIIQYKVQSATKKCSESTIHERQAVTAKVPKALTEV
jgi:hypothetical protein